MDVRPSGRQFEISWRDQRASIVEMGGGTRDAGRPVLDRYPSGASCHGRRFEVAD